MVSEPTFDVTRGHLSTRHPGTTVRVTLTPQGPLVDGSRRPPITFDLGVDETNYSARRHGIPLGVYQAAATVVGKDGVARPLRCARTQGGEYGGSVEVFWEGARNDPETRTDSQIHLTD